MFTFDILCTIRIKFLPGFIKGVIVFIGDTICNIISSLIKKEWLNNYLHITFHIIVLLECSFPR